MPKTPEIHKIGTPYTIRVVVTPTGFVGGFQGGSKIGLARDNITYYETIGRWLCREVGAGRLLPDGQIEDKP